MATAKKTSAAAPAASPPVAAPAAQPAVRATRARARPALKPAAPAASKPVAAPKPAKPAKPKKVKRVRDSFTMPETEVAVLGGLKARATKLGLPAKKSEVLRAGLKALTVMSDSAFLACLNSVPAAKARGAAKD